jgi:hypothetical protein
LSPVLLNLYGQYLNSEALEWYEDFKRGQGIRTVKNTDKCVLLANKETVLQRIVNRLTKIGRYYGVEINVEETKVMRLSKKVSPVQITIDQK